MHVESIVMEGNKCQQSPSLIYDEYVPKNGYHSKLPVIVILHGILDCKKNWKHVAEHLAGNTKRKVYVLDIPDHDYSKPQDLSYETLYRMTEDFLATITQPVVVIGHSMGGVIGYILATKKPHMVSKLVIIDISPIYYPKDIEKGVIQCLMIMRQALAAVPKGLGFQETKNTILSIFEKVLPSDTLGKLLIENLIEGKTSIQWRIDLDSVKEESRKRDIFQQYPLKCLCFVKTLLIHGELSEFLRTDHYNDIKIIVPEVTFHCIKQAGHAIHMEKPEKLVQVITEFLKDSK